MVDERARAWRRHWIGMACWMAALGPVALMDRALLGPVGGGVPVDFSGAAITAYGATLAVFIPLASLTVHLHPRPRRIPGIHLLLFPLSAGVALLLASL